MRPIPKWNLPHFGRPSGEKYMYRHLYCKCVLITGLAGAALVSTTHAQNHLIDGARGEVSRVIQLKNDIEAEVEETVSEVSSRQTRLASNPLAKLTAPTVSTTAKKLTAPQVAFDEISSSQTLMSGFKSPTASAPKPSTVNVRQDFTAPKVYIEKRTPASNASFTKRLSSSTSTRRFQLKSMFAIPAK